eukprot:TRINITY_DN13721_c0_g1_i3.p1 TRINITY_DN13721_c0_g1~~TRINITY_DN13721_c0_g1_i3.p1  ORF type:complete len:453 (+),score=24.32 TRINITY_DN13721_c0_g1_i3:1-1359(+)
MHKKETSDRTNSTATDFSALQNTIARNANSHQTTISQTPSSTQLGKRSFSSTLANQPSDDAAKESFRKLLRPDTNVDNLARQTDYQQKLTSRNDEEQNLDPILQGMFNSIGDGLPRPSSATAQSLPSQPGAENQEIFNSYILNLLSKANIQGTNNSIIQISTHTIPPGTLNSVQTAYAPTSMRGRTPTPTPPAQNLNWVAPPYQLTNLATPILYQDQGMFMNSRNQTVSQPISLGSTGENVNITNGGTGGSTSFQSQPQNTSQSMTYVENFIKDFQSKLFQMLMNQNKMLVDFKEKQDDAYDNVNEILKEMEEVRTMMNSGPSKTSKPTEGVTTNGANQSALMNTIIKSAADVTAENLLLYLYNGKTDFRHKLILKGEFPSILYRERNFKLDFFFNFLAYLNQTISTDSALSLLARGGKQCLINKRSRFAWRYTTPRFHHALLRQILQAIRF